MNSLLVMTAFGSEYQALWEPLQNRQIIYTRDVHGYAATRGIMEDTSIDLLVTGSGPTSVRNHLAHYFEMHKPKAAVCIGFCGGLSHSATIGTLALPDRCLTESGGVFSPNPAVKQRIAKDFFDQNIEFLVGDMLSVPKPVETNEARKKLNSETSAVTVDMESAYFAEICEMKKLPWFVMKSVMDDVTTKNFERDSLKPGLEVAKKTIVSNLKPLISNLKMEWHL